MLENKVNGFGQPSESPRGSIGGTITNNIIKLNVGGYKFFTTRETLSPSSFFNTLLNGNCGSSIDNDGFYFIDRDGDLFSPILSYLRTGIFSLPNEISFEKIFSEIDFYRVEPLIKLLTPKKQYNNNLAAGGTLFINKLPIEDLSLKILNTIIKGNLIFIYYESNRIDCYVYKGITFHWIKLFTIESPITCYQNLILNITKNNFNEITQVLLAGSNDKTIITWKVMVDYASISISDKIEKIYELKHYSKYLHFIANGLYLGCLSTNGYITILDLASNSSGDSTNKFLKVHSHITSVASDFEQSLYFACSDGKIYEIKQNLRDNFVWSLEEIYKLNDPEFFQNTFGFSSKAMDKYKTLRNRHNTNSNNETNNNSNNSNNNESIDNNFESEEKHESTVTLDHLKDRTNHITCLNICIIPYSGSGTKTVVAIGVRDGTVHLASKNNNTRTNDKFVFVSKYFITDQTQNTSIQKLQVSGGKEGIFISALSSSAGISKTWYFNYENSMKSPVSKCVSVHSTSSQTGGFDSCYVDILKFKNYVNLHFHSNRNEKLLYSPKENLSISPLLSSTSPSSSTSSSPPNQLVIQTSSSGKKSLSSNKYFTIGRDKSVHLQKNISSNTFQQDDHDTTSSSTSNNTNLTNNTSTNTSFENIPKLSYYNQIYVIVNVDLNQLIIYPNSNRNIDTDNPHLVYQTPIATISLLDPTPIRRVQLITFGGIEPNINDQTYQLLTIHESNEIYSWDLTEINSKFQ
ncbi:hypothetical protein DLAC_08336 [Tieghemostelium lacteum]|uniref:BTB domain-containing protein n=1 Tax=Tieghemostelium lacteum TaxID=361077 RepID=A0A151ZBQ8_TIELA|nr:hypothetical protein DLAC_08336 [Tieghemostelium lacteum]|eukprot:KYQ91380.1 hypothetical protein DLAC_08336 [Tieghemostelium lacteum]